MATYNGVKYIKEQIYSILRQLAETDELIISDDGSVDGTIEFIKKVSDKRIRLYSHVSVSKKKKFDLHTTNHYIAHNFENALQYAKGNYIFFSDQDDIWFPEKVRISKSALENNDMVISNFSVINEKGEILIENYRKRQPFSNNYILSSLSPQYTGCVMAFRREILDYVLPFPKDISFGHDNWMGLCVTKFGRIKYIDTPLIYHRLHGGNNSGLCGKSPNNILKKMNIRFSLLFNILSRMKIKVKEK
jgi:glycosyltransferase involved in cell wall biosynthesis